MFGRLGFFILGVVTGGVVVVRALSRRPTPAELRRSVIRTGADMLDLTARALKPKRNG